MIEVKHVSKRYGKQLAVDDLNLKIEAGSFTAILGPNGAGKSTTLQMLIGLLQPTSGVVCYQGHIKTGFVFQASVLDDDLTVRENLLIRAHQYRGISADRVETLIAQLGLSHFSEQFYGCLSGGQKRRVDIARALLNQPDVLFLDEPTTGLDIQTRAAIWTLLGRLQKETGMTIVLTTHYLDEADDADLVYIVDHGKVIAKGSARTIKAQYARNVLNMFTDKMADLKDLIGTLAPISKEEDGELTVLPETTEVALEILQRGRSVIRQFDYRPGRMDDAFMALTGREVR